MAALETVINKNSDLVRKGLNGGVLLGRYPAASLLTTLHAVDGITVPSSYESVGWTGEDGVTFGIDDEVSEVRGWGGSTFIRRDTTSSDRTVAFSALETKRLTKELHTGLDLSAVAMSAQGEVVITHPDRPATKYWRTLVLGTDGDGDERYYFGKFYPRAAVTEREEETWADGDDPMSYAVTMSGMLDTNAGFALREFLFGPGALAAATAMGWTLGTLLAPTALASGAIAATTVALTWSAVANASGYQIQRSTDNGDTWSDVAGAAGGAPATNSTTVTGLTASTAYRFRVLATSAGGGNRGPASTSIGVTTTA